MSVVLGVLLWAGIIILVNAIMRFLLVPVAILFEVLDRRERARTAGEARFMPSVSVVVPAFNEEKVLEACVDSIVAAEHGELEVLIVDDGSSDDTYPIAIQLAARYPEVRAYSQRNRGKGAAINFARTIVRGDIVVLVDADGRFGASTLVELVRPFRDARVGAVCGDDRPINLDRVQTRFLALIGHIGTGLMRRAYSLLRILPIVSGNSGAFRRSVLEQVDWLPEGTLAEDLDLTWRVHAARHHVRFAPRAIVHAESPSTIWGLWKQRVRWARGFLQTCVAQWRMLGNPRHGLFGLSLVPLLLSSVALPVVMMASLVLLVVAVAGGVSSAGFADAWTFVLWLGIPLSLVLALVACAIDRSLRDLRHAWTLPLWPCYSLLMSLAMLRAILLQATGTPPTWNKLDRTAVVSEGVLDAPDDVSSRRPAASASASRRGASQA